jgi:hypothetical protein
MPLEIVNHLAPFTVIPLSCSVSEAHTRLQQATENFVVLGDSTHPRALKLKTDLLALTDMGGQSLVEVIKQWPSPIFITDGVTVLENDDLEKAADLLADYQAAGIVVYQDGQVVGIIATRAIIDALPPDKLTPTVHRGEGSISIPARKYICRICRETDPPPWPVEVVQGNGVPPCTKNPFHGNEDMEIGKG